MNNSFSLGCLSTTVVSNYHRNVIYDDIIPSKKKMARKTECKPNKEVENTMANTERDYLMNQLREVGYTKIRALEIQFRMYNSEHPNTYKELIDAIKNDAYTLDTKATARVDVMVTEDDELLPWGPFYGIKFNLPTAPDRDGYAAANKEFVKQRATAERVIMTGTPAEGLKALQDFEAWTA